MRNEGIAAAREARESWVVEAPRGSKATIRSLIDDQGRELLDAKKICEAPTSLFPTVRDDWCVRMQVDVYRTRWQAAQETSHWA